MIYTMVKWNLITGKKKQTSGFRVSNSQPTLSLELMEKSQIAGKEPTRKSKNLQKCLQLCHTKYHITFLSTYFSNVRDPFPPQTVSKISHHKIKYMLKPCKDIFDEKKLLSQALLHPETGIFVSNYIQKGWLVSRLLCRVAVSREMKEQR